MCRVPFGNGELCLSDLIVSRNVFIFRREKEDEEKEKLRNQLEAETRKRHVVEDQFSAVKQVCTINRSIVAS